MVYKELVGVKKMDGILEYFGSLDPAVFVQSLPGNIAQGILWGIMALGVYITFRILNFADLTVDGSFATGGAVTAVMLMNGASIWVAMVVAFFAGLVAGLVTGLLHTVFGIPDILSGILSQIALYPINLHIMNKFSNLPIKMDNYGMVFSFNSENLNIAGLLISMRDVYMAIIVAAVVAIIIMAVMYWYFGTEQGSAIRATGANPKMAAAQGININLDKVIALALSNAVVATAGSLIAQYQGFADVNMGRGAIVIGLAAVIIGQVIGEALFKKHFNFIVRLIFVVIGGILYYLVMGVVLWLKMPPEDLKLFTAIIVAIFLAIPYLRNKSKTSFKRVVKMNKKNDEREAADNA